MTTMMWNATLALADARMTNKTPFVCSCWCLSGRIGIPWCNTDRITVVLCNTSHMCNVDDAPCRGGPALESACLPACLPACSVHEKRRSRRSTSVLLAHKAERGKIEEDIRPPGTLHVHSCLLPPSRPSISTWERGLEVVSER
jgi:hypothetical protein